MGAHFQTVENEKSTARLYIEMELIIERMEAEISKQYENERKKCTQIKCARLK